MTAQVSDTIEHKDRVYDIIGVDGPDPFAPSEYGIKPTSWITSCYRGHTNTYVVRDTHLVLEELRVSASQTGYPEINGRAPQAVKSAKGASNTPGSGITLATYVAIDLKLTFTGRLRIARGFIADRYVHQGFQSSHAFGEVIDLQFSDGLLVNEKDRSQEIGSTGEPPAFPAERAEERIARLHSLEMDD